MTRKAKFSDLSPYRWRRVRRDGYLDDNTASIQLVKQTFTRESVLDLYSTSIKLDELIVRLREFQEKYEDMRVVVDHDSAVADWDSCEVGLYVEGWRDATDDEVDAALAEVEATWAHEQQWQERQIEMLKKQRPELFKE